MVQLIKNLRKKKKLFILTLEHLIQLTIKNYLQHHVKYIIIYHSIYIYIYIDLFIARGGTTLSAAHIKKSQGNNNVLPPDVHYEIKTLTQLFNKPRWRVSLVTIILYKSIILLIISINRTREKEQQ